MNSDTEFDASLVREPGIALDHATLDLDGAAYGIDHAAELNETSVAGALDYAAVVHRDGRINQIAAERPQTREGTILVRAGKSAIADNIRRKNSREFPGLGHKVPS
jgi:hypothetical protein